MGNSIPLGVSIPVGAFMPLGKMWGRGFEVWGTLSYSKPNVPCSLFLSVIAVGAASIGKRDRNEALPKIHATDPKNNGFFS